MIRQLLIASFILLMFQSVHAQVGLFEKPEAVQTKEEREQKYENLRDEKGRRQGNWMRYHPMVPRRTKPALLMTNRWIR
ncbi:hypothetical protein [Marinilabilia salmonicolor]|uniref:hypothetical protein n=1 Tax=Marinilabilia salmonicolor TaxID=989 RepID=UPI001F394F85|nr:hypothetical protein [Marinilabilia salmonicolor]